MQIREQLEAVVNQAIAAAIADGALALDEAPAAALERPRDPENGDWASTVAMRSAKLAHANPRDIAQAIVDHIPENDVVKSAEIAGPGFINFRLTDAALQGVVAAIREQRADYGRGTVAEGERKVNLEYISANPTGPMHIGHGRWAALGDSMARVMRHAGYDVYEEFYVNDHGTQMDVFGNSISVRYMQLLGHDVEMPEQCYGGAYVADIAQGIIDREGRAYEDMSEHDRMVAFREIGYREMLDDQRNLLERFGTTFDRWFSERDLYVEDSEGKSAVDRALEVMRERGYIFEAEDATWFRSTEFGDDKDRVLIKANGELTYFTSDMAYHYDKVCRGFDRLIDIWGADHHGYIKRCEAMMEAWGHPGMLEVVLGQLVNLLRDGEPVRMSKRTGEMVTFEELVDEVGVDATRYLMLSRSSDQPVDFDIEVAKKQDASNPVYYVQYAHARICSVLRKAADADASADELAAQIVPEGVDLTALTHESELALMRKMDDFTEMIALAARDRAPYRLTHYAQELASLFHQFYTNCHIIGEEPAVQNARLALADATRILLALTLGLLGVSAPERM
ncbi:MAG: arginine--tRNA ligase [Eggerthellaceae bacterium]|nr:arginine--tRNA ligase [Eggerthellaceae bacterium]